MLRKMGTAARIAAALYWRCRSLFYGLGFRSVGKNLLIRKPNSILGARYISIGCNFEALDGLRMEAFDRHNTSSFEPCMVIGDDVSVNRNLHIAAINRVEVGNRVLIASDVYISDHEHGPPTRVQMDIPPSRRELVSRGPVIIGDDVWIGEKVCIMPGVTIGRGSIIGAGAIVTRDVPSYAIAAGVPARIIKKFEE